MNKIYIDYNNGIRKYYAYVYKNDEVMYTPLTSIEIAQILETIINQSIVNIIEGKDSVEIVLANNISLIIDQLKVLYPTLEESDKYFAILVKKINSYVSLMNMTKLKQKLPPNYIPKVNRQKFFESKEVISDNVSFLIAISLATNIYYGIKEEIERNEPKFR